MPPLGGLLLDVRQLLGLPINQLAIIQECLEGEEREFFVKKMDEMKAVIQAMPVTYSQSELGDEAVAYLHYFMGGMDWYITEKDVEGDGTIQAYGMADLGYGPECGYISIMEIVQSGIYVELDLHWQPKKLSDIKK